MNRFVKQNFISLMVGLMLIISGCSIQSTEVVNPLPTGSSTTTQVSDRDSEGNYDVVLYFPGNRYPETATHINSAIEKGKSNICTIDRDGADDNRKASLRGIPTKKGYDRDEFPMALCEEGGEGADIAYVTFSDNRGSGSWVGKQLKEYPDGTRVLFVVDGGVTGKVVPAPFEQETAKIEDKSSLSGSSTVIQTSPEPAQDPVKENSDVVYYSNCNAVREAGANPLYKGEPGYSTKLDRDQDGVACEN